MQISLDKMGALVEQRRKSLGWSQEQLSEKTGINRQIIGRIEAKKQIPSIVQMNALIDKLGISFEEITEEQEQQDVFMAMMGAAKTDEEKAGFEKMISIMLCLRKHDRLRRTLDGGSR